MSNQNGAPSGMSPWAANGAGPAPQNGGPVQAGGPAQSRWGAAAAGGAGPQAGGGAAPVQAAGASKWSAGIAAGGGSAWSQGADADEQDGSGAFDEPKSGKRKRLLLIAAGAMGAVMIAGTAFGAVTGNLPGKKASYTEQEPAAEQPAEGAGGEAGQAEIDIPNGDKAVSCQVIENEDGSTTYNYTDLQGMEKTYTSPAPTDTAQGAAEGPAEPDDGTLTLDDLDTETISDDEAAADSERKRQEAEAAGAATSESGGSADKAAQQACDHEWIQKTKSVKTKAKYKTVTVPAVYETKTVLKVMCNTCGATFDTASKAKSHVSSSGHAGYTPGVPVSQKVLTTPATTKKKLVKKAGTELQTYYQCSLCGKTKKKL